MNYSFTESDLAKAAAEWGCNCGPTALAFALQRRLEDVRWAIPGFEEKGYTTSKMMKQALSNWRVGWTQLSTHRAPYDLEELAALASSIPALVLIQWTGPWAQGEQRARYASKYTHWITLFQLIEPMVFDCNGGITSLSTWDHAIASKITANYKRADGGWYPLHVWRLLNKPQEAAT